MRGGYTERSPEKKIRKNEKGIDSLSKRPALFPPAGAAPPVIHLAGMDGASTTVAANTWEPTVSDNGSEVAVDRWFDYVFDSDGEWSFNNLTGLVERAETAVYVMHADADFGGVSVGELIGVAIKVGSGVSVCKNVIPVTGGLTGARVSVSAVHVGTLNGGLGWYARPFVYAEAGGDLSSDSSFTIQRFQLLSEGTEYFAGDLPP